MKNNYNILGIIPARKGSKRVKRKNFRKFAGSSLVEIAIKQAIKSKLITDIALSSDNDKIYYFANKYKRIIPIKRPDVISDDKSPAIDYVNHCLKVIETDKRIKYDLIVIIQPSSPLRTSKDIDNTINLLINNPNADSAVSVVKVNHMVNPIKMKILIGNNLIPYIENENGRYEASSLPELYVRNCAVYVSWRRNIDNENDILGNISLGYVMPQDTAIDINEMIDFKFAEFLINNKKL